MREGMKVKTLIAIVIVDVRWNITMQNQNQTNMRLVIILKCGLECGMPHIYCYIYFVCMYIFEYLNFIKIDAICY